MIRPSLAVVSFCALFLALAGCQQAPPAADRTPASSPTVTATAAADDLRRFVGRYPTERPDGFLAQPQVQRAVRAQVTDAAVAARVLSQDATATPVVDRDGMILAYGCEPHNCGAHNWSIELKPDGTGARVCYKPDGGAPRWYGDDPVGAPKDACPSGDTGA